MSECPACGGYDPITFDEADLVADFIESNMPIVPARLRWVLEQMTRRFADAYRYGGVVGQDYLGTSRKNADALSAAHERIAELERAANAVIERWDTPAWKDAKATAEVIGELRKVAKGGRHAPPRNR